MAFRLGLVGAGRMGLTHLEAIRGDSRVTVAAVAEPRDVVANQLRAEGLTVVSDPDELGALDLDGYLVSTPSGTHRDVVSRLATSGRPILCEKPAGLSVADAESMKSACLANGSRLQIGYWRRFVPALRKVRDDIERGDFGRLLCLTASQWDNSPPSAAFRNSSGGIAVDMGVHEIDEIRWLSGQEVTGVSVRRLSSAEPGVVDEDAATIQLDLSEGTLGLTSLGRFFPGADFVGIEVMGERRHIRRVLLNARTGTTPQLTALRRQARAFASGRDPHSATIDDAIAVLRVLEDSRKRAR